MDNIKAKRCATIRTEQVHVGILAVTTIMRKVFYINLFHARHERKNEEEEEEE